jgi:hypothetical protein
MSYSHWNQSRMGVRYVTRAEWLKQTAHRRENGILCHVVCSLWCIVVLVMIGLWMDGRL